MKRFLGLTDEELAENENLWKAENNEGSKISTNSQAELRGVGVTGAGIADDTAAITAPEEGVPPEAMPGGQDAAAPASPMANTQPPA
jgi:hypothetical protein